MIARALPASAASRAQRVAMAVAIGLGLGLALYLFNPNPWQWTDGDAYWLAALRLRAGQPLYVTPGDFTAYRYAPWFAYAWVPLTFLPKLAVITAWRAAMLGCVTLACWPVRHTPAGRLLIALTGPMLVVNAIGGNVEPALVALLVWAVPRGRGWGVGLAAGLKVLPLAYVAVFAWRRQWVAAGIAVAVATVLWAPALLFDLSGYPPVRGVSPYDLALLLPLAALTGARLGSPTSS